MAEEDAYGNKRRFERRAAEFRSWVKGAKACRRGQRKRKYLILNRDNVRHFKRLCEVLDARNISYVRRNRYLDVLVFICAHTNKNLARIKQHDVDKIVAAGHEVHRTRASKKTFLSLVENILRALGVRGVTLSRRVDRSLERRFDRASFEDICRIIRFLRNDCLFRAFVTTILETFIRPQELVWRTMKDVTVVRRDGRAVYARVDVSSHGKEGTKVVQIKDTLCYFMDWYDQHPHANDPDAYLFPHMTDLRSRLDVSTATEKLKRIGRRLGVKGRLSSYELKTLGVTFACHRLDDPKLIQAQAGWASIEQLATYDKTTTEDVLNAALARDGLLDDDAPMPIIRPKDCPCGAVVGFAQATCPVCKGIMRDEMIRLPSRVGRHEGRNSVGNPFARAQAREELVPALTAALRDADTRRWLAKVLAGERVR